MKIKIRDDIWQGILVGELYYPYEQNSGSGGMYYGKRMFPSQILDVEYSAGRFRYVYKSWCIHPSHADEIIEINEEIFEI